MKLKNPSQKNSLRSHDSVGQTDAVTFKNVDDAKDLATASCHHLTGIEYKPFECHGQDASVPEMVRVGLPGWFPDRLMNSVYANE
jgi:hypothetical protein